MLKNLFVVSAVLIALILTACSPKEGATAGESFGAPLTLESSLVIDELFQQVSDLNGKTVRVKGTVSDLCKHKGCWMQVKSENQVLTVRFKDEAFTLPASAIGKDVDFEGLFIAEKMANPMGGAHSGCAEGGNHEGGGTCENERAEHTAKKASNMRYTMVSTGLVLI